MVSSTSLSNRDEDPCPSDSESQVLGGGDPSPLTRRARCWGEWVIPKSVDISQVYSNE